MSLKDSLDELIKKKSVLEHDIENLLTVFFMETGCIVDDIHVSASEGLSDPPKEGGVRTPTCSFTVYIEIPGVVT